MSSEQMIVVSDTTPLISLMKIDRLNMLRELFSEVIIPVAVFDELTSNPRFQKEAEEIRNYHWIQVVEVEDQRAVDVICRLEGLDLGESEAIVLSDVLGAKLLLMDEAKGRDVARTMGITITGTVGLLLTAYRADVLTKENVMECIDGLRASNRHIGEYYLQMMLHHLED